MVPGTMGLALAALTAGIDRWPGDAYEIKRGEDG